jgi:hypothetical protein
VKRADGITSMVAEGLVLVSSTTERDVAAQRKDGDADDHATATKTAVSRRKRTASTDQSDGQVSQALRSVYQRAIDEDIPSEMLDLLRKLD